VWDAACWTTESHSRRRLTHTAQGGTNSSVLRVQVACKTEGGRLRQCCRVLACSSARWRGGRPARVLRGHAPGAAQLVREGKGKLLTSELKHGFCFSICSRHLPLTPLRQLRHQNARTGTAHATNTQRLARVAPKCATESPKILKKRGKNRSMLKVCLLLACLVLLVSATGTPPNSPPPGPTKKRLFINLVSSSSEEGELNTFSKHCTHSRKQSTAKKKEKKKN
jgi:hypothetical protein